MSGFTPRVGSKKEDVRLHWDELVAIYKKQALALTMTGVISALAQVLMLAGPDKGKTGYVIGLDNNTGSKAIIKLETSAALGIREIKVGLGLSSIFRDWEITASPCDGGFLEEFCCLAARDGELLFPVFPILAAENRVAKITVQAAGSSIPFLLQIMVACHMVHQVWRIPNPVETCTCHYVTLEEPSDLSLYITFSVAFQRRTLLAETDIVQGHAHSLSNCSSPVSISIHDCYRLPLLNN